MKSLSDFWQAIRSAYADPSCGGAEIGDRSMRFVMLGRAGAVIREGAVPLASGVVEGGAIADAAAFGAALGELRAAIRMPKGDIPVVLSVSPALVYAQAFSLPYLKGPALEEAAALNLRVISPIDMDGAYADWQAAESGGEDDARAGVPALGAFAERAPIDAICAAFASCGFVPVAVEFASLSVSRAVADGFDPAVRNEPALGVSFTSDGMMFFIMKGGVPRFTRFVSWDAAREGGNAAGPVTAARLKAVAGMEVRRLLDFYRSRWKGSVTKAFVANATSDRTVASWIKEEFGLEVFAVGGYQGTDPAYLAACGAAIRGMMPRAEDRLISVAPVGTEERYFQSRISAFMSFWRTATWVTIGCAGAAFLVLDIFAARIEAAAVREHSGASRASAARFEAQALAFNAAVARAQAASDAASSRAPGIAVIFAAQGDAVRVTSLNGAENGKTAAISGTALTEQAAIAFKRRLSDTAAVERVDMPLASIVSVPGQKASFSATVIFK